ncbi:HNH endonuclease [Franconibacter helveticus]|uniref:HNH endonuclease n=1 Tax=Franconibacter helveticus TaxID=357240 RepID=UPI000DA1367F|nr:HNH endonuclease [Franconibacter helveticus]
MKTSSGKAARTARRAPVISGDEATAPQGHERGHSGKWQRIYRGSHARAFFISRATLGAFNHRAFGLATECLPGVSMDLSKDVVDRYFSYDPKSGVLYCKTPFGNKKCGDRIGGKADGGYLKVRFKGKNIRLHRIIWILVNGEIPSSLVVDHIDGDKLNNRISNLRLCTQNQNTLNRRVHSNNASGFKGVYYNDSPRNKKKWIAQISIDKRKIRLGRFYTKEEAHEAYVVASKKYHGEFSSFSKSIPPRSADK